MQAKIIMSYSNEFTRRDVVERLEKYKNFAENQVEKFVSRRVEESVIYLEHDEGAAWGATKHAPMYIIKDRECDSMQAQIPTGGLVFVFVRIWSLFD